MGQTCSCDCGDKRGDLDFNEVSNILIVYSTKYRKYEPWRIIRD